MEILLIFGIIWFISKFIEEKSWNTNAYDGKKYDIDKAFYDSNVRMTLGEMSKKDFKRNHRNGKYSK